MYYDERNQLRQIANYTTQAMKQVIFPHHYLILVALSDDTPLDVRHCEVGGWVFAVIHLTFAKNCTFLGKKDRTRKSGRKSLVFTKGPVSNDNPANQGLGENRELSSLFP